METLEKIKRLKSVLLCLQAHPDNEPNSEFADRISDLEEIIEYEEIINKQENHFASEFADWFIKNNYEESVGYYEGLDLVDFFKEHIYKS